MAEYASRGLRLHYEEIGTGRPLVLLHGITNFGLSWAQQLGLLTSLGWRVVLPDVAGHGRSAPVIAPTTPQELAADVIALLDQLHLDRAVVGGLSLGGMVAQQIALHHPARVRSLVLGGTHSGGRRAAFPESEVVAFFRRRAVMPSEEAAWASVPYNYGPRGRAEQADRIAEDIERRLHNPFNERAYRAQLLAASLHNCYRRLDRIRAPTLVVHGARDRIIPVANAHMTAERVPGAQLEILDEAGHLYPTEEPAVDEAIGRFFAAHA